MLSRLKCANGSTRTTSGAMFFPVLALDSCELQERLFDDILPYSGYAIGRFCQQTSSKPKKFMKVCLLDEMHIKVGYASKNVRLTASRQKNVKV